MKKFIIAMISTLISLFVFITAACKGGEGDYFPASDESIVETTTEQESEKSTETTETTETNETTDESQTASEIDSEKPDEEIESNWGHDLWL